MPDTTWKALSRGGLASRIAEGSIIEVGGSKSETKHQALSSALSVSGLGEEKIEPSRIMRTSMH